MKTQPIGIGLLSASLLLCLSNLSFAQVDTVSKRSQASSRATISGSNTSMTGSNTQVNELSYSGTDVRSDSSRSSSKPIAYKKSERTTSYHKSTKTKRTEPNK